MTTNPPTRPENEFEDLKLISILSSSSKVGAATGTLGLLLGSIAGVLRSSNPILFSLSSGIQCFGLGTIYTATRQSLLHASSPSTQSPTNSLTSPNSSLPTTPTKPNLTILSALSGSLAGASMAGLTRGRANVIPGAIFWGLAGLVGQEAWSFRDNRATSTGGTVAAASNDGVVSQREPFWVRWSPMKSLSDEEYEKMLRERLLRLDAEIEIVDEDLARARAANGGGEGERGR